MNIFIIVEGYTELTFVKELLAPHLLKNGANLVQPFPVNTNANLGRKGGGSNYDHYKKDILRTLAGKKDKIVTTFVDFYGLPPNFPNYHLCLEKISVDDKIECIEKSIKEDIAADNHLFVPYIQKHEFETLLFSSNAGFEQYFERDIFVKTQAEINLFNNPEEINDNPQTAPSKRLAKIISDYDKESFGNIIALEIGLRTMLENCPRFNKWVETLIKLARS